MWVLHKDGEHVCSAARQEGHLWATIQEDTIVEVCIRRDLMTTQDSQGLELPRPAVLGIASGIFFLTFFGAVWGFISAVFMSGAFQVVAFILVGLVTLGFFGMGGMLMRYAHSLPKTLS